MECGIWEGGWEGSGGDGGDGGFGGGQVWSEGKVGTM